MLLACASCVWMMSMAGLTAEPLVLAPRSPELGRNGILGFTVAVPGGGGSVLLRMPETLNSSLGLHFIDHNRDDMPALSPLTEKIVWESDAAMGALSYETRTSEGVVFGCRAVPDEVGVWVEFYVRNETGQLMAGISHQQCLVLNGAPGFAVTETLEGIGTWSDDKVFPLGEATPTPAEKGRAPWLLMPTAAMRKTYPGPSDYPDGWWLTDQDADLPLLFRESADGKMLIAIAWDEQPCMLMTNTRIPCLHAGPSTILNAEPGETARWRGRVYVVENDKPALRTLFIRDRAQGFIPEDAPEPVKEPEH